MLKSLIAGDKNPDEIAQLARGQLVSKEEILKQALVSHVEPHHRFILSQLLSKFESIDSAIIFPSNHLFISLVLKSFVEGDLPHKLFAAVRLIIQKGEMRIYPPLFPHFLD